MIIFNHYYINLTILKFKTLTFLIKKFKKDQNNIFKKYKNTRMKILIHSIPMLRIWAYSSLLLLLLFNEIYIYSSNNIKGLLKNI